jgi:hypothetical protein
MKARLTCDLFDNESANLKISTCPEIMKHMPRIYKFMERRQLLWKISGSYDRGVFLQVGGENLMPNLDNIRQFIVENGWGK